MPRKIQRVEFRGSEEAMLAARLERPAGPVRAWALFAHCFTCSKDSHAATRLSRSLAEHGIGVLRFDFTGLGGSDGDFANTDFSSNIADIRAAADWLTENEAGPQVLVGHSLGGTAVLMAAPEIESCRAVVTLAAPADPAHVRRLLSDKEAELETSGEACVEIGGRDFRIREAFVEDLEAWNPEERLAELGRALLVLHSPSDSVVEIDNARRIYEAARHPKSFVSLDGADHLLRSPEDAAWAAGVAAAWAGRYIQGDAQPREGRSRAAELAEDLEAGWLRVVSSGQGKFHQFVTDGRHLLEADEPEDHGGDDRGLSPYQLLAAGLGACTSMTLQMYARRKGWDLERVRVDLSHGKIHAEDCEDCETKEGRIDRIERAIQVEGNLDQAQRARLLEIADKCPVHKTLEGEIDSVTREKG